MILDYTEQVEKLKKGKSPSKLVIDVSNYVQHHLSEPIDVEALAKSMFLRRTYLATKFKKESGTTLTDFILKEKVDHIVFDFEDTRFMDSSGIGIIMGRYRKIACFGGQVYAIHADSRIRRIIGISGLKKVLHIIEEDGHGQSEQ